jgi:hypothetical protein
MRPGGDPLQMTEAEKRAAEWEARHDVAARGHRAGPDVLQHYFAHERLTHAAEPQPAGAHPVSEPPQPAQPAPAAPKRLSRGLLRRLLRRGD